MNILRANKWETHQRGRHHPMLACDVENDPKTGSFICAGFAGLVSNNGGKRKVKRTSEYIESYIDNQVEFLEYLSNLEQNACVCIFFNLRYDRMFFDELINHGELLENGGRIIRLKLHNGVQCWDLCNHVQGTLEDWIGYLKMQEKWGIRKVDLSNKEERVMNDVRATYRLAEFIEDFYYYECDTPMKLTAPSTALEMFRRHFLVGVIARNNPEMNDFERAGYYGGRSEILQRGESIESYHYDVNSMYPSVMAKSQIPEPGSARWGKYDTIDEIKRLIKEDFDFVCDCEVEIPVTRIAPLPVRTCEGAMIYPTGHIRGVWFGRELSNALRHGVVIDTVHKHLVYNHSSNIFQGYVEKLWGKRQLFKREGNKGMEQMVKVLLNSLYGKFGQHIEEGHYYGRLADCTEGDLVGAHSFDYEGVTFIRLKPKPMVDSKTTFPIIAACITADARVVLHNAMVANDAIYCDTDSIMCGNEAVGITIGKALGEWGYEGHHKEPVYSKKQYGNKHKGIPKRAQLIKETNEERTFRFEKPNTYKECIREHTKMGIWRSHEKTVSKWGDTSRVWNVDGTSMPIHFA